MPSRRALLSAIGTAASVGTAGCVGRIRRELVGYTPIEDPCDNPTGTWPTAGGDPGRTGRADTAPPAPDAAAVDLLAAARDDGQQQHASTLPVVADGTAYIPVTGGLVAVDLDAPMNGPIWDRDLDNGITAVPVLACGAVFAPGMNQLAALDRASGERYWRADAVSHHRNDATAAALDDTIYVAGFSPAAVDIRTGTVQWLEGAGGTLALDDDGVYTTRSDSQISGIFAYDLNGEERWRISGEFVGSASVLNGMVWVADYRGTASAIDARTGEVYWSRSLSGVSKVDSGLAVAGDEVFVPAGTGTTSVALDATTGEIRWAVDTGIVTGRPVVGDDWVAFGRTNDGVSVYDRSTGEERTTWSRAEHHLGTIDGVVPVKEGFVIREGSSSGLSLLR
ncbi:PQQ-like beta-propeller repeat protein [Halosolutus halophilus]|uniref:PQQ-like beta-propeller repeat protein n=1 Tax=Halosolutus halophilus TaxID=1552990 RepID=UPI0022351D77|nr:PQQ-like beta-propeller repeat protein [Halosolutus halophilus]